MNKMKFLELYANDENKKLIDLMKSLESFMFRSSDPTKISEKQISSLRRTYYNDKKSVKAPKKGIRGS